MDASARSASIATSVAIGTSLLAGLFSVFVAMRSRSSAAVNRDTAASSLFGIAVLLMVVHAIAAARIAAARIAAGGIAAIGLLRAALLLTAAFAVVGIGFGLIRGLRRGASTGTPSAALNPLKPVGQ